MDNLNQVFALLSAVNGTDADLQSLGMTTTTEGANFMQVGSPIGSTTNAVYNYCGSCGCNYAGYHYCWFPHAWNTWQPNKMQQAFKIVKALMDEKSIKINSVKKFIDLVDKIQNLL
jgi:hypothetical protein